MTIPDISVPVLIRRYVVLGRWYAASPCLLTDIRVIQRTATLTYPSKHVGPALLDGEVLQSADKATLAQNARVYFEPHDVEQWTDSLAVAEDAYIVALAAYRLTGTL